MQDVRAAERGFLNPFESTFRKCTTFVVIFGLGVLALLARVEWATHGAGRRVPAPWEIATVLAVVFLFSVYLTQKLCKKA